MKQMILISVLPMAFMLGAGCFNGAADTMRDKMSVSVFAKLDQQFWNPRISWKNKYQDWDNGDRSPAFPLSTTLLVFLTDGWHLANTLSLLFIKLALLFVPKPKGWKEYGAAFAGASAGYSGGWHIANLLLVIS